MVEKVVCEVKFNLAESRLQLLHKIDVQFLSEIF